MAFNQHRTRGVATGAWPVLLDSLKLPRKHPNGYYYLHFRRQDEATGATKADMETTRTRTEAGAADYMRAFIDHHKNQNPGGSAPTPTLASLIDQYLDALHREGPGRAKAQTDALLAPMRLLGNLQPGQIDQARIDRYLAERTRTRARSSGSLHRELAALRTALKWASNRKLFPATDLHYFKLPPCSAPKVVTMSKKLEARVQQEATAIYFNPGQDQRAREHQDAALFLLIALNTGSRKGAILELEWERVDFTLNEINFCDPKRRTTKKRRAVVPIMPRLEAALKHAHQEACARWDDGKARGRLFTKGNLQGDWRAFTWLIKKLGITAVGEPPMKMTPHVCRHTFITLGLEAGFPIARVAAMVGDTIATIERYYNHTTKEALHETFAPEAFKKRQQQRQAA